jgi:hypothetical protein
LSAIDWLSQNAQRLGLPDGGQIRARYVWNAGGFANESFAVTMGDRQFHLKFVSGDRVSRVHRWLPYASVLERDYHAPHLYGALETDRADTGTSLALVFDHVQGHEFSVTDVKANLAKVAETITRLHRDRSFQTTLASSRTLGDVFVETIVRRLRGDLDYLSLNSAGKTWQRHLRWWEAELTTLEVEARGATTFAAPADSAIHGDPQWSNILLGAAESWYLIDWDDFRVDGDAMLDLAVLVWPLRHVADYWRQYVVDLDADRAITYERALLLNEIVDSLTDEVAAGEHRGASARRLIRAKRLAFRSALAEYQARYGRAD